MAKVTARLASRRYGSSTPPLAEIGSPHPLVVNVSARHMHLNQENLEILFGKGASSTDFKDLYQQGEFASEQLVTVVGPRQRIIPNVRILGRSGITPRSR